MSEVNRYQEKLRAVNDCMAYLFPDQNVLSMRGGNGLAASMVKGVLRDYRHMLEWFVANPDYDALQAQLAKADASAEIMGRYSDGQDAEIKRLEAQLAAAQQLARDNENWFNALKADFDKAQKDAADAKRYRHMRNNATFQDRNGPGLYWYLPRWDYTLPIGERLDAAIDAALGRE